MTTTPPRPPVHTTVLPAHYVTLDQQVREDFLSDDLGLVCAIAGKTGNAVLIASAGLPRKNRESAFTVWRRSCLDNIAEECAALREYLPTDQVAAEEFAAGTVDLIRLDSIIHAAAHEAQQKKIELLSFQKKILRDALSNNCEGMLPGGQPQMLVVRGDGEMKLLKNSVAAKEWGAIGNLGFYLIPLSIGDSRRWLPAE